MLYFFLDYLLFQGLVFFVFAVLSIDFSSIIHRQLVDCVSHADEGTQRLGLGCCERYCYDRGFREKDKVSYNTIVSVFINFYSIEYVH